MGTWVAVFSRGKQMLAFLASTPEKPNNFCLIPKEREEDLSRLSEKKGSRYMSLLAVSPNCLERIQPWGELTDLALKTMFSCSSVCVCVSEREKIYFLLSPNAITCFYQLHHHSELTGRGHIPSNVCCIAQGQWYMQVCSTEPQCFPPHTHLLWEMIEM